MLTKGDLKEIRKVVREEVEVEVGDAKDDLRGEIKMAMMRAISETRKLGDRIKNLEIENRKLRKDVNGAIDFFDERSVVSEKKIEKLERRFDLASIS